MKKLLPLLLLAAPAHSAPLHDAVRSQDIEAVRALIEAGADLEERGTVLPCGFTPLHAAADFGWPERTYERIPDIMRLLLEAGADPNAQLEVDPADPICRGETPLLVAATRDNPLTIELLVEAGADLHAVDRDGKTALHVASSQLNGAAAAALLDAGASPDAVDYDGYNALGELVRPDLQEPLDWQAMKAQMEEYKAYLEATGREEEAARIDLSVFDPTEYDEGPGFSLGDFFKDIRADQIIETVATEYIMSELLDRPTPDGSSAPGGVSDSDDMCRDLGPEWFATQNLCGCSDGENFVSC